MVTKRTGTLGGTTTDETDPPLTTMLTFDNNATTSGWKFSKTANSPRWIQDKNGNIICFPVMLMDFDRANTVQQPLGGMSIRDPTTISYRANVSATPQASNITDATYGLVVNSRQMVWDMIGVKWLPVRTHYSSRTTSAVAGTNVVTIGYAAVPSKATNLAIHFTCSAGTATLTVEVGINGTDYLTIESVGAAAAGVMNYSAVSVGGTLGISPLPFPYVRITVGTAGAGNTTTLTVAMK